MSLALLDQPAERLGALGLDKLIGVFCARNAQDVDLQVGTL